jgi:tetratricopeptide (TPR) repeat protein
MATRKDKAERDGVEQGETRSEDNAATKRANTRPGAATRGEASRGATSRGAKSKGATNKATTKQSRSSRTGAPTDGAQREIDAVVSFDRRLMEQQLAAVTRLLEEQDFETIEEANAFLKQLVERGKPLEATLTTPLEEAQQLVFQALRAEGDERLALARRALEVSPDCADAYLLLAEVSESPDEARRYYEQGVAAGERALGPEAFAEDVGHFWGLLETRPYMRARQGLAEVLWHLDERKAAIEHARDLLRLNPGDNQGIRYQLATWLVVVGDDAALEHLLDQYPDEWSANWAYTRVLHAFRAHGAGPQADAALEAAMEVNPFVPMYMLGVLPFPEEQPEYYGMGDQNEAAVYLFENVEAWEASPEAGEWLVGAVVRIMGPKLFGGGPRSTKKRVSTKPASSGKRSSAGRKPRGPKRT